MGGRTTTLSLEGSAALTPVAHKRQHTRMRPAHTGSPSHESRGPSSFGTACATIISNRNEPPVKRQGAPSAPVRRRRGKRSAHEKTQAFLPRTGLPCSHCGRGGTAYRGRHAFGRCPICPASASKRAGKRWTKHPPQRMRPLSRCTSGKTHPGSRTSAKRRLPSRPRAKWRNTSSRRSLQPRRPSPSPLSIYRALSTSRPPPNGKGRR